MDFLVYGLQRSGTNYLEELLKKKFRGVRYLNDNFKSRSYPTQKHFRLYDDKSIVPEPRYSNDMFVKTFAEFEALLTPEEIPSFYLVLSKDPYSWYQSYLRWAERCGWEYPGHHYIEEYNLFYKWWYNFSKETNKVLMLRYEDLLLEKDHSLNSIQEITGLKKKWFTFGKIKEVRNSGKFDQSRRDYYSNQEYLNDFTDEELALLNEKLDKELAENLGYTPVLKEV